MNIEDLHFDQFHSSQLLHVNTPHNKKVKFSHILMEMSFTLTYMDP